MQPVRRFLDLPAFFVGVFFLYWCAPAAHLLSAVLPQAPHHPCQGAPPCSQPALALRRLCGRRSLPLAVLMNQVKFWKLSGKCTPLLVHAHANARHPVPLGGCVTHPHC